MLKMVFGLVRDVLVLNEKFPSFPRTPMSE